MKPNRIFTAAKSVVPLLEPLISMMPAFVQKVSISGMVACLHELQSEAFDAAPQATGVTAISLKEQVVELVRSSHSKPESVS